MDWKDQSALVDNCHQLWVADDIDLVAGQAEELSTLISRLEESAMLDNLACRSVQRRGKWWEWDPVMNWMFQLQTWKCPFVKNTENAQKSWKAAWNQGKIAQIGLKIKQSAQIWATKKAEISWKAENFQVCNWWWESRNCDSIQISWSYHHSGCKIGARN